jgi:hypothetical protein
MHFFFSRCYKVQERAILVGAILSMSPLKIALETRHLDQTCPMRETPS